MVPLAAALEREHRQIDEGIAAFTSAKTGGEVNSEPLARAMNALRRHIYLEEQFLFPPLRSSGLMGPVFVMLREHGEMWQTLDELDAEMSVDGSRDSVVRLCDQLTPLLEAHNAKEETIIYAQADAMLDDSAGAELQGFIDTGTMPAGWVCERAPQVPNP